MLLARTLQRLATISPGLVMLVLAPAVFASQVRVEVEGDVDNLQDNAQIFVGEVEGRTADGLRRYANTAIDRKSTRLNSSHVRISYAVFCLKKKTIKHERLRHN